MHVHTRTVQSPSKDVSIRKLRSKFQWGVGIVVEDKKKLLSFHVCMYACVRVHIPNELYVAGVVFGGL